MQAFQQKKNGLFKSLQMQGAKEVRSAAYKEIRVQTKAGLLARPERLSNAADAGFSTALHA
jgi:hypothetical protein